LIRDSLQIYSTQTGMFHLESHGKKRPFGDDELFEESSGNSNSPEPSKKPNKEGKTSMQDGGYSASSPMSDSDDSESVRGTSPLFPTSKVIVFFYDF
jgi:hypothetical protein